MPDKTNVYVDGEILETNDGVGTKDNVPLREAEITGKINELLRLMMDNDVQSIDSENGGGERPADKNYGKEVMADI